MPYDASARVPLIIRLPPGSPKVGSPFVTLPTSHVDLFPTIMDLAQVPAAHRPTVLQGESLASFLAPKGSRGQRGSLRKRAFNVIQFHGCDIAMSWFSIVDGTYKYTVYGTGEQHPPQLFNMVVDPGENVNIAQQELATVKRLDALLKTVVDYPSVAMDVAQYNHESLATWVNNTKNWEALVTTQRWQASFDVNANASIAAMKAYLATSPQINKCRSAPVWPPSAVSRV